MNAHKTPRQFIKYFGAAGVGYIADFLTLILLHELLYIHYLVAASLGFVVGLVVVFALSGKYVFSNPKLKSKTVEFLLFALIGVIGLLMLNCIMWLLTGLLGVSYIIAKIVATFFVYTWNFFARKSLYHD